MTNIATIALAPSRTLDRVKAATIVARIMVPIMLRHRKHPTFLRDMRHARSMCSKMYRMELRGRCLRRGPIHRRLERAGYAVACWWLGDYDRTGKRTTWGWKATALRMKLQPWLYVNGYDYGQQYGGGEEGGWWYDVWTPIESHRVPRWKAKGILAGIERGEDFVAGRLVQVAPSPADTDPSWDGDDDWCMGVDNGTRWRIECRPGRDGSNYRPYC